MSEHAGDSVEALVERVRRPLDNLIYEVPGWKGPQDWRKPQAEEALEALTALAARAQEAERERDATMGALVGSQTALASEHERALAAEAALREATEALQACHDDLARWAPAHWRNQGVGEILARNFLSRRRAHHPPAGEGE